MYTDPSYGQLEHNLNPEVHPCDVASWESWEDFIVRFWCLKTSVFDGLVLNWKELHQGATFNGRDMPHVRVNRLTSAKATQHSPSKSGSVLSVVDTEQGKHCPSDCEVHILSAANNSGADSFCCMEEILPDTSKRIITFAISNKYSRGRHVTKSSRSLSEYTVEHQKAASDDDLFVKFTTGTYTPLLAICYQVVVVLWIITMQRNILDLLQVEHFGEC